MQVAVEVKNITKTFPGVLALDNVSLQIPKGQVHAICGENGAGKSTLMKILGGVYDADTGDLLINGEKKTIRNVAESRAAGISVVYQEFNLVNELTVAENLFITELPSIKGVGVVKSAELNQRAKDLLDDYNINISPKEYVKNLSVAQQQMVEIAKALSHNSEILIMDEPTGTLSTDEVENLYAITRRLKKENKTVLYISHRLKEIFDICDAVSILRDGKYIGTKLIEDIDSEGIVKMMVGRNIDNYYSHTESEVGEVVLEVKNLTKEGVFENISFQLRKGEILGVSGLMGSGREEILKAIYGLIPYDSGEIYLHGKKIHNNNPRQAISRGFAFLTEDRKEAGIFELMTVRENLTMNILSKVCKIKGFYIDANKERDVLDKYTEFMNMKYSDETQRIMNLSGGNQQKFVLARAIATDCEVLLLLEPTRGIDVGAKAEIYTLLGELSAQGMAILAVSSELPEIISMCHRTITIWQGKLTGELSKEEMNETNIMLCATGSKFMVKGVKNNE